MFEFFTDLKFDWMGWRKPLIFLSVALLIAGLVSAAARELTPGGTDSFNLGVDFQGGTVLTVTHNGYGKRTDLDEYRLQSRGGFGIINIQTSDRNGKVVGMAYVHDHDQLMLISQQGMILRMVAKDVRAIGRATQGVRLIGVEEGDQVVSVAKLAEGEDEENGNGGNGAVAVAESDVAPATDDTVTPDAPDNGTPDDGDQQ